MGLFSELRPIKEGIGYFYKRAQVIQGNIANADTPFYEPRDLTFERQLDEQIRLKRTDPRHIDPRKEGVLFREVKLNDFSGYDGNKVNLDKELAKLSETAIMARTLNEVLRKEIGKLKLVIGGR